MADGVDYRTQARRVRREAQERLAALRAARRGHARYQDAGAPAGGAANAPSSIEDIAVIEPSGVDDAESTIVSDPEQPVLTASSSAADLAAAATQAATPDDEPVAAPIEASPEAPGVDAAPAAVPSQSDLADLPGVGPGLIWMLEQNGVQTLADLASCDEDKLKENLGFVGKLVNLNAWIRVAKDAVAA